MWDVEMMFGAQPHYEYVWFFLYQTLSPSDAVSLNAKDENNDVCLLFPKMWL